MAFCQGFASSQFSYEKKLSLFGNGVGGSTHCYYEKPTVSGRGTQVTLLFFFRSVVIMVTVLQKNACMVQKGLI